MVRVAINGFGRIGRTTFRVASKRAGLEIVAINDLGDLENLAYLLKYDTVYGRFDKEVRVEDGSAKYLAVDGRRSLFIQEKDPAKLPWKDLDIDIVIESTGAFESYEKASGHIKAGAKRVIISAPAKDEENEGKLGKTALLGVNEVELENCKVCSNGSCTTNAASPIIAILSKNPGIEKALLNTVHGYTATQNLVDGPTKGKDFRRGRAAGQNIVPSFTGAAISVTRAIPSLHNLFDGIAMRVPVATGSAADITFIAKRNTSVEEVNDILRNAAKDSRWENVFTIIEDQVVSSDIIGMPYAAIADLAFTRVVGGNLVKVLSWYDNEWGYSSILVEEIVRLGRMIK